MKRRDLEVDTVYLSSVHPNWMDQEDDVTRVKLLSLDLFQLDPAAAARPHKTSEGNGLALPAGIRPDPDGLLTHALVVDIGREGAKLPTVPRKVYLAPINQLRITWADAEVYWKTGVVPTDDSRAADVLARLRRRGLAGEQNRGRPSHILISSAHLALLLDSAERSGRQI